MNNSIRFCLLSSIIGLFILICIILHHAFIPLPTSKTNFKPYTFNHDETALSRFMGALGLKTISWNPKKQNWSELTKLRKYIYENYPSIHGSNNVVHEVINQHSLLYIIKGADRTLKPIVLLAHMDVVPTDGQVWDSDPFKPTVRDGYVYARGTLDDKGQLFSILEAVEALLKEKHEFERDVILAFGHDEEISGYNGAKKIAERLHELGYRKFEFTLDEGLLIIKNPLPQLNATFAMIGTSQKGYATANLSVEHKSGHSSMPGKESAIGILSSAINRIESSPYPSMMGSGVEQQFLNDLAAKMPLAKRIVMSNMWLFKPVINLILSSKPQTNAMIRTTAAVTQFHAGIKENVLSPSAWATVNLRVHPSQTVAEAITHLRSIIADDRVKMDVFHIREPMGPAKSRGAFGYDLLEATVYQMNPTVHVTSGLMIAMTDSPWYKNFTDNLYLFNPSVVDATDLPGIHGPNERLSIKSYQRLIEFYYRMLKNMKTFTVSRQSHSHNTEL